MKKGLIMCLLLVMLFIFSGCGGNEDSKKSNENNGSNKNGNDVILNNKKEAYNKNNDTLSSAIIKDIGGIKTYTVYEGSKGLEHDELEDSNIYEIRLLLTEDNNYYMDHGSFAGHVSVGTYEVDDNKLILNQAYILGSDCSSEGEKVSYIFTIKDGNIIATIGDMKDIELKESNERFGYSILFSDSCEVKIENGSEFKLDKAVFAYNDSQYEIELQFLPYNNYLLTYCNTKDCYSSVGTYSYDNNYITLSQTKYQGNDVCYYYQNKEFRLSYTKKNDGGNQKIVDFDTITINLKDIEGFIDKELVLMEGVKTYLDNLYYSEDFFGVYCGRK